MEPILTNYWNTVKVLQTALSLLYLLLEDDPRQKYSVQEARQFCLHANLLNQMLDIQGKVTDVDLKSTIQNILNMVSKDLS
jgi:hypothetical protein